MLLKYVQKYCGYLTGASGFFLFFLFMNLLNNGDFDIHPYNIKNI